ncbi:mesoderm induction early response protein 1-like [Cimex lectularius]|uniref:Mesoderm induction early response protein 1 n=1 Tax=Cimex lectularius TaxID=79782 RepID=A0A8I6RKV8_CIMLE|nr:mesoderm induction early response protein 1-like [Cimex lectularius]XP_014248125.1 mesoderm induction early response protein 1-like [Cimex lectularius]XP_014248126.1 mesoderm induction early response protein 1-like [Cimex lectularius]XP_014248128.1 mesoderm induction early response protein 1-like [Cimex lectularius]XP_014248129.1 mesoderm induction early response protein 1-like [Cimex lectularius]
MDVPDKETSVKKNKEDGEFTPSVEMMVHDYDDERTLEEEEALGPLEDPQVELSSLQKEGDMPLEDLMAMYGYNETDAASQSSEEINGDRSETESTDRLGPSELEQFYNDVEVESEGNHTRRNVRIRLSEDEEDFEYYPDEESRKRTIMVGNDYQAWIPEVMNKYEEFPYENEDKLVWDPNGLLQKDIEAYLIKAQEKNKRDVPKGKYPSDDEQALFLLLQCGHNIEEALRRRINTEMFHGSINLSEEECKQFESGLVLYGKRFHLIQQNQVRTRTVRELVEFYYWWKRTERYDIYMKARLEQGKFELDPTFTDYMIGPNRIVSTPSPIDEIHRTHDDQGLNDSDNQHSTAESDMDNEANGDSNHSCDHLNNGMEIMSKKNFA